MEKKIDYTEMRKQIISENPFIQELMKLDEENLEPTKRFERQLLLIFKQYEDKTGKAADSSVVGKAISGAFVDYNSISD